MEGWIKLHRSIKDNWIWQNSTYLRAWIIMLFTVNYEDKKVLIHGNIIECKRGQSLLSLDSWVDKFGLKKQCGSWTIQKVRTFFDLLETDQMITKETIHKTTRLTICNYNYYQDIQQDNNKKITRLQHDDNTIITQTKESKEEKNKKKEEELKARALIFKDQIRGQKQNYSDEMLKKFYEYWIEPNKSKTKMRFEGEKYFDISRRLATWASRDKNFKPEAAGYKQTTIPKDVR